MAENWIIFGTPQLSDSGKTLRWRVYTKGAQHLLGVVSWFSRWRRYAFHPEQGTVFEQDCLRVIADFCEEVTKTHRAEKKLGVRQ